jgi:hypothetical protein
MLLEAKGEFLTPADVAARLNAPVAVARLYRRASGSFTATARASRSSARRDPARAGSSTSGSRRSRSTGPCRRPAGDGRAPGTTTGTGRPVSLAARGNRKLRAGNVQEMRYLHREGWALPALAEKFGLAYESVWRIVRTKTQWRHITEPDWEPGTASTASGAGCRRARRPVRLGQGIDGSRTSRSTTGPAGPERSRHDRAYPELD